MATSIITAHVACKKCGCADRYKDGKCKSCVAERVKRRADKMREALREYSLKWRELNIEKVRAFDRERSAKLRLENPKKRKEVTERYATNNKDKISVRNRAWKKNNPESRRLTAARRRLRESNSGGVERPTAGYIKNLFILQKGLCACCRESIAVEYHIDHVIPLAMGGEHSTRNLQLLCPSCNLSKHAQHPVDFMQSRGYLL